MHTGIQSYMHTYTIHAGLYRRTHTHTGRWAYALIHTHIHIGIHIHAYIHADIHTNIHSHIHTHMHTHIHTHTQRYRQAGIQPVRRAYIPAGRHTYIYRLTHT